MRRVAALPLFLLVLLLCTTTSEADFAKVHAADSVALYHAVVLISRVTGPRKTA